MPVWVVKASSIGLRRPSQRRGPVGRGQGAADRGGGGDQRRDQVGAAALALPALEVAVRGRRAALARARAGRGSCPGTSSSRPSATRRRRGETSSRPSASACARTRIEPGTTSIRTPSATWRPVEDRRRRPAGPRSGRWCTSRGTRCRRGSPAAACRRSDPCRPAPSRRRRARSSSAIGSGSGTARDSGRPCPGLVPQVTNGVSASASRSTSASNVGVVVGAQRAPVLRRPRPTVARRGVVAALQVVEGGVVRARSCRPGRPPRWTCCRPSSALPSTGARWRRRGTPARSPGRRRCRSWRSPPG